MVVNRMTKLSKQNLLVADSVRFEEVGPDSFLIRVSRNGNASYIHHGDGGDLAYNLKAAYRLINKHRPDLSPTSI